MLTEKEKEENQRRYEETKKRFQERDRTREIEDVNYKLNRIRLLNKLCTLYITTKPQFLWNNNPYIEETKKFNISDIDCFNYLPDYYVWLSKQMYKHKDCIKEENNSEQNNYEVITWSAVRSTIIKKWSHYELYQRYEIGIPGTRRELYIYLDDLEKEYGKYFKDKEEVKEEKEESEPKKKSTKRKNTKKD